MAGGKGDLRVSGRGPGVEFGQPHIDADKARQLLDLSALDRVNGSLHTLPISEESGALRYEPITLYRRGRRKG